MARWGARKEQELEAQRLRDEAQRQAEEAAAAQRWAQEQERAAEQAREDERQRQLAAKIAEGRRLRDAWERGEQERVAEQERLAQPAREAQEAERERRIADAPWDSLGEDERAERTKREEARRHNDWWNSLSEAEREDRRRQEEASAQREERDREALRAREAEAQRRADDREAHRLRSEEATAGFEKWSTLDLEYNRALVLLDSGRSFSDWRYRAHTIRDLARAYDFIDRLTTEDSIGELWLGDLAIAPVGKSTSFQGWAAIEVKSSYNITDILRAKIAIGRAPKIGKVIGFGRHVTDQLGGLDALYKVERVDPDDYFEK